MEAEEEEEECVRVIKEDRPEYMEEIAVYHYQSFITCQKANGTERCDKHARDFSSRDRRGHIPVAAGR